MNLPGALHAASANYSSAWREFATAARDTANHRKDLAKVIRKGVPAGSTKHDQTLAAVGRLQGSKDALEAAQEGFARQLDSLDSATKDLSPAERKVFDEAVADLKKEVAEPPGQVRWNTSLVAHDSSWRDGAIGGAGFAGGIVGFLGSALVGAATGAPDAAVLPILGGGTVGMAAVGAGLPVAWRARPAGSAFTYVDTVAKLADDAVEGKRAGRKIALKTAATGSDAKVTPARLLRGLDRLADDSEKRAARAEGISRNLEQKLREARAGAEQVGRLKGVISGARAEAAEGAAATEKLLRELDEAV